MLEANRDSICRIIKKDIDIYFELEVQVENKRYRYYIVENDFNIREYSLFRWFNNIIKEYNETENFIIRNLKTNILYDFNLLSLRSVLTDKEIFQIMFNLVQYYNVYTLNIKDKIKFICLLKTKNINIIRQNLSKKYSLFDLKEEIDNYKLNSGYSKTDVLQKQKDYNKYNIDNVKYSGYSYFEESRIKHFYIIKD